MQHMQATERTCRPRSTCAGHETHMQVMEHTCRSRSTHTGHGAPRRPRSTHAGHGAHVQAMEHTCRPWSTHASHEAHVQVMKHTCRLWSTRAGQRTTLWPLPPFRSGGSKLGHQVCTASALPMEPSCQAVLTYLKDEH